MMYAVLVELLTEEEVEFERLGHLDALARDVCQNQSKYESRVLGPLSKDEKLEFADTI